MNGFGIYSETQGEFPDVVAAKELIQVLSKITGFKPDLRALNREEKRLKQLQNSLETKVNNEAESKTRGYIT